MPLEAAVQASPRAPLPPAAVENIRERGCVGEAPRQAVSGAGLPRGGPTGWRGAWRVCGGAGTLAGGQQGAAVRPPRRPGPCRMFWLRGPAVGPAVVALSQGDRRTAEARHSQGPGIRIVARCSAVAAGLL